MTDLFCFFCTSEDKIIILCSVKFAAKHTDLFHQLSFCHEKVADIIDCAEQILIEIRFEMRLEELMSIHRHLILIGIDHLRLR